VPDIRKDFEKTAGDLTKVVQDAAYMAIGLGIMGFQQAQVRRREILEQIERQRAVIETIGDARQDVAKAVKEIDRTMGRVFERLDSSMEPVSELLPPSAQAVVQQARELRDQLRGYFTSLAA
jgi:uncharacterized membrane protein YccC